MLLVIDTGAVEYFSNNIHITYTILISDQLSRRNCFHNTYKFYWYYMMIYTQYTKPFDMFYKINLAK